uniref:Uncharacterized protein n=2 Tax=unclassified Caudoviricetes TaxID=2788787 RepID=A0A8S5VB32_9CAUD|nr:MAG TPA: hypothetical protein [Siphoviridae sp. ctfrT39]DAG03917.1 MAG TPA: hypothetical protein [Siphoviridae sp. ct0vA12]
MFIGISGVFQVPILILILFIISVYIKMKENI